ncbi:MAG: YiiX/YebB-like N1pC/P60 family cysteine hydrolase [Dermatophilaceae bacterium]
MTPSTLRRRLAVALCGAGIAALAVPAAAIADTPSAPVLSASQQAQIDLANQRTTQQIVKQALTIKGGVDPKAAKVSGSVGRSGTYPTRKGTFLSTDTKFAGLIPTGHSAMVYSSGYVIESLSSGVQWGSNNWYAVKPHVWGMTTRATTSTQDSAAADWVKAQLGKPYNYNYYNMGTRSSFYCSQLVWASFRDTTGIDLNTSSYDVDYLGLHAIHPMELPSSANSTKVSTFYVQ